MNGTKENILLTALELFSRSGYEAVSVSDIAGRLGMTKSALYKHYKNKRDIFDSITARMEQRDAERSRLFELPEEAMTEGGEDYSAASLRQLIEFSKAQLRYWTEDEFASAFRRLLTLEQYRDGEMRAMYQQYLAGGSGMLRIFWALTGCRTPSVKRWNSMRRCFFSTAFMTGRRTNPR